MLSTFGAVKGTSDCESSSAVAVSRKIAAKKNALRDQHLAPIYTEVGKNFRIMPKLKLFQFVFVILDSNSQGALHCN